MSFEELVTKQDLAEVKKALDEIMELTSSPAPEWLQTQDAMAFLGIGKTFLTRLRCEGRIKHTKIGGMVYFNVRSFYDHLDSISAPLRAA